MTLLELAEQHVPMRKVGNEWHGPCPACGTGQRDPRLSDRFSVKADRELFFCRTCTPGGGDAIAFLRTFEGKTCPEAHALLGKACASTSCPVIDKCSQGKKNSEAPMPRSVKPPVPATAPSYIPAEVTTPAERWLDQAAKLIAKAHAALLECPDQLKYLEGRGLPLAAVQKYRLGYLPADIYRPRQTWGLPEEAWPDGKPKPLKIHRGILIPTLIDDRPHRLRVRRSKETLKEGEPGYIEVKGSGNDRVILNATARALVIVESDLDALLVDWCAGDLVGAMPTVSAAAKPKESTWPALQQALAILVASDIEPKYNEEKQRWENVGGKAATWWLDQFPRAKRWPVPAGKDPGEYYQEHGGDIRAWVLAGLPPVFHLPPAAAPGEETGPTAETKEPPEQPEAEDLAPLYIHGQSKNGYDYYITEKAEDAARLRAQFPGEAVFTQSEILKLKGMAPEEAEKFILVKRTFPESRLMQTQMELPCQ